MHLTSLPGPHGSGDMGRGAREFADFLVAAGHRWWQVLPLAPIGYGNSPYSSISAFAGGGHLISLESLVVAGLLKPSELPPTRIGRMDRVSYGEMLTFREARLRDAFARFQSRRHAQAAHEQFCVANRSWLNEFALFSAIKRAHNLVAWTDWPRDLAFRDAATLRSAKRALKREIEFEKFLQFVFDGQWTALKRYCNGLGLGLIGDAPIFVSHDSADVWANQSLYLLDKRGYPTVVSGVPPDYFSKTGQRWGHPLYDWPAHARGGYKWWVDRFKRALARFDAVRIDHFLGFNRLWNVPARAKTAMRGKWTKTPGDEILSAIKKAVGTPAIIAEDLGLLVPEAADLRDRWGFPGMRILQFAFDGTAKSRYDQPHRYARNCVAYTGTHDNDTTVGWFRSLPKRGGRGKDGRNVRQRAILYTGGGEKTIHEDIMRTLYASAANTAIVPMQDVLGLDGDARMNFPSTQRVNWEWRMRPIALTSRLAERLRDLADTFERAR